MNDPQHPILVAPWTYRVTEVQFRCGGTQIETEIDLTLSKEAGLVTLRFIGVSGLEIEDGFPWNTTGLEILDTSSRGWDAARIRVSSFEQDPAIRFWAQTVSIVAQQCRQDGLPGSRLL